MDKTKRTKKRVNSEKKILGVGANIKNLLIAIALLFGFLAGFFRVYSWVDDTYARRQIVDKIKLEAQVSLGKVKIENDYRWETIVLNGLYSRYHTLDSVINFALDPTKVDPDRRQEFNELKAKIKLQEEKVKVLQERLCKGE